MADLEGRGIPTVGVATTEFIEGAAAVPVAAYLKHRQSYAGQNVALVICGRNIPLTKLEKIFKVAAAA